MYTVLCCLIMVAFIVQAYSYRKQIEEMKKENNSLRQRLFGISEDLIKSQCIEELKNFFKHPKVHYKIIGNGFENSKRILVGFPIHMKGSDYKICLSYFPYMHSNKDLKDYIKNKVTNVIINNFMSNLSVEELNESKN